MYNVVDGNTISHEIYHDLRRTLGSEEDEVANLPCGRINMPLR